MNIKYMFFIFFIYTINIPAFSNQLELISKNMDGSAAGSGYGWETSFFYQVDISFDGRYIVFASNSNQIVPGDTNIYSGGSDYNTLGPDIFLYDRMNKSVERISFNQNGSQWESCICCNPSISDDGLNVVYQVIGPMLGYCDIYLYNRDTISLWLSASINGHQSYARSENPRISSDGNYVVFQSNSNDIIYPIASASPRDVFIRDIKNMKTELITFTIDGKRDGKINIVNEFSDISANGRFVCFMCNSTELTSEGVPGIFVRDMENEIATMISLTSDGRAIPITDTWPGTHISDDGRYVLFSTGGALVPNPPHKRSVYIHDRETEQTTVVPLSDVEGDNRRDGFAACTISATGRYIAFCSGHEVLTEYDNLQWVPNELYRYDRETGMTIHLVSAEQIKQLDEYSTLPQFGYHLAITPDGKTVVFTTNADYLVPEDTNSQFDVYAIDIEDETSTVSDWELR